MAPTDKVTKDAVTIREDIIRTIKNGLIANGVQSPNAGPTSDFFTIAAALANELATLHMNGLAVDDARLPDTAMGDDLQRFADIFDVSPQAADGSVGAIVLQSSAAAPIPTGAELTDDLGQRFYVLTGGTYANGDLVPIRAKTVGYDTNHEEGDVLTWASAPPFCADKASVAIGGLVNGTDAGDSENVRQRLLAKLRSPPSSGNPQDVAEAVEQSSGSVKKAFVYPAVRGPSTCDAAAVASPTATSKSRAVAASTMAGAVVPYAQGCLARQGDLNVTTVQDVNADVAVAISIPNAPTASSPGPGGGWKNGTPWPAPNGTSSFKCSVTSVTSAVRFVTNAEARPVENVSRIAWLSPYDWTLYTALVTSVVGGSSGSYEIVVDQPMVGIAVGCFVWPDCENAQAYVGAVLAHFASMGPGEKTTNASALVRGFRHPPPSMSWPNALDAKLLFALSSAQAEIASALYLYRADGVATVNGSSGTVAPQVPASTSSPPNIYVPRHIGFYPVP